MDPETKQAIIKLSNSISTLEEQMKNESKDQIELQLHEQYAVNNNANVNSIITFIVGIVAVLGAYGAVFINTDATPNWTENSFADLAFVGMSCILVLGIISYICISVGSSQRYEQFTIHAIRCKMYKESASDYSFPNNKVVFNSEYHPFNKECVKFIQGIFLNFCYVCHWLTLLIFVSYIFLHLSQDEKNILSIR